MKNLSKSFVIVVLILLAISAVFALFSKPFERIEQVSLTQVVQDVNEEKIGKIIVTGNKLVVSYKDGDAKESTKEPQEALPQLLLDLGVLPEKLGKVNVEPREATGLGAWIGPLSFLILPALFFFLFLWMIFRQAKAGIGQAFDFTKAKARLFGAEGQPKEKVTFKDVAGLKEAKEELQEVVDFLKYPKKYLQMGAKIPRGVLLVGPPGTGKTLLARAVANEAGVPFFSASGSEFIELFVGVGSSVAGDTPILIRTKGSTKLLSIGEFVDQFYQGEQEGHIIPVQEVETLGYDPLNTKVWGASKNAQTKFFGKSGWKKVEGVYRHKVKEIYKIQYLGGTLKTTGDHSVFIRHRNFVVPQKVENLKEGDVLVNLPFKVRGVFLPGIGTTHKVKAHEFQSKEGVRTLPLWNEYGEISQWGQKYEYALSQKDLMPQQGIAASIGVSQGTVGNWQNHVHAPKFLTFAAQWEEKGIPQNVPVTPSLLKLLGYYTAEGRTTDYYTQLVFGSHETQLHEDTIQLSKDLLGLRPHLIDTKDNATRITLHSKAIARFFEAQCGNGSHKKHVPEILWDLPKEYFLAYLEGFTKGDGYTDQDGRLAASSVSKQLIIELVWLSAMHGIQVGMGKSTFRGGRIIKSKPLPEGNYWTIKFGKTSHPFTGTVKYPYQFKKPTVQSVTKLPYEGYVYDLCGCENEAFFGGEKPTLLHNSRVRDLFSTAKKAGKSIVFVDELDAIGRTRGFGFGGGHDEREQTLNQILVEMDGFERDSGVIVCAATNRPDVLDPALLRPGRFDRRIILDFPDVNDREEILKIHTKDKPLGLDINLREIAERTPGFAGADLANLANEAAILAARRNKTQVFQTELLESIDKVLLGPERKSHVLSKKEKEITAYHEAGHALIAASLKHVDPVRKVSIISRGRAGGYTLKLPSEDRHLKSRAEFVDELAVLLGGYTAEQLVFGDITTGPSNDLEKASEVARAVVKEFGMSEKLGPITFGEREWMPFLGRDVESGKNYSETIAVEIDREVARFIEEAKKTAEKILKQRRKTLDKIAQVLIEKETIEKEEFEQLIGRR